jgi:hypothetical protein
LVDECARNFEKVDSRVDRNNGNDISSYLKTQISHEFNKNSKFDATTYPY